ncbi:MAG: ankyrin repeat domain-containing protein, partial [Candidatus Peribacteraceae bacterium]|nr:ankyrin repeat domain-containing protein [Candidatus Peribacteraceae bacterium]
LGYLDIVEYLIEKGADFNINNPARRALFCGHLHVAKYLISLGAKCGKINWYDINMVDDSNIIKFLHQHTLITDELFDKWLDLQTVLVKRNLKVETEEEV